MLDFSHSLVIGPFLFHLVPSVALRQGSVAIALRKGVEHPYIKKMRLYGLLQYLGCLGLHTIIRKRGGEVCVCVCVCV